MPEEQATYARPFAETLREIRKGALLVELADELLKLVADVLETEKPGELMLKLKVSPTAKADDMVTVQDVVAVKTPKPDRPNTWFFVTPGGELSRDNPNQTKLPFSAVERAEES